MVILEFWGYWFVAMFGLIMGLCIGYWIGVARSEPEYDVPKPPVDHDARAWRILQDIDL